MRDKACPNNTCCPFVKARQCNQVLQEARQPASAQHKGTARVAVATHLAAAKEALPLRPHGTLSTAALHSHRGEVQRAPPAAAPHLDVRGRRFRI